MSTDNVHGASVKNMVLAPPYPTLHKHTYSILKSPCVSTWNLGGANGKNWF